MDIKRRKANSKGEKWNVVDELILMEHLRGEPFSIAKLQSLFPNRTLPSLRSKVRKLRISNDLFGDSYRREKILFTKHILELEQPKVIFDAYAGVGHQTFEWITSANLVFASDKMPRKRLDFENTAIKNGFVKSSQQYKVWDKYTKDEKTVYFFPGDAIEAVSYIKVERIPVDLVDLDTCGSSLPTLSIFLSILKPKHIVITHGEFHSLRFKRIDVLKRVLSHRDLTEDHFPKSFDDLAIELDKAVKLNGLRSHNETQDSHWLELSNQVVLGGKSHGMLRRHYVVKKPLATADCLNYLLNANI